MMYKRKTIKTDNIPFLINNLGEILAFASSTILPSPLILYSLQPTSSLALTPLTFNCITIFLKNVLRNNYGKQKNPVLNESESLTVTSAR